MFKKYNHKIFLVFILILVCFFSKILDVNKKILKIKKKLVFIQIFRGEKKIENEIRLKYFFSKIKTA